MAFQTKYEMSITLVDKQNRLTTVNYDLYIPSSATTDAAKDAAARVSAGRILSKLALVSAGTVARYSISIVNREDSVTLPTTDVPAAESGSITVDVKGVAGKFANIRLPMPNEAVRVAGARGRLNQTLEAFTDFVALFQDGEGNRAAFVSDGEVAGSQIVNAVTVTRTSRSG